MDPLRCCLPHLLRLHHRILHPHVHPLGNSLSASDRLPFSSSHSPFLQRDHILSLLLEYGREGATVVEVYRLREVNEMPCEDLRRRSQLSHHMNFYQECYYPFLKDAPLICLVSPLPRYQIPIPKPESLQKIWHDNMLYNKLTKRKGYQGWMKEDNKYFIFPSGCTMFLDGAMQYIKKFR